MLNNKAIAFLKLVRFENLLMIVFTQWLLRYVVLQKIVRDYGLQLELGDTLFALVIISTVLIAAAGYIINDYFDVKTDLINHPDTVVVDRVIKRRWAIILHISFTFLGLVLGVYAALKTGYLRLAVFHVAAAVLLWFYSTHFKKMLLVGNVVVSLLTAAVAFMPFVYEMGVMQKIHPGFILDYTALTWVAFKTTALFSVFAFLTSMAREIIKDVEDYKGDAATGGSTLPIAWGIRTAKLVVFFVLVITFLLLFFVLYNTVKSQRVLFTLNNLYLLLALMLPLLLLAGYLAKASESREFKRASLFLKLIMLLGLSYSFIFYYS